MKYLTVILVVVVFVVHTQSRSIPINEIKQLQKREVGFGASKDLPDGQSIAVGGSRGGGLQLGVQRSLDLVKTDEHEVQLYAGIGSSLGGKGKSLLPLPNAGVQYEHESGVGAYVGADIFGPSVGVFFPVGGDVNLGFSLGLTGPSINVGFD